MKGKRKNKERRLLGVLVACIMLITSIPIGVSAEEQAYVELEVGVNTVTSGWDTTIYEFVPAKSGTYRFFTSDLEQVEPQILIFDKDCSNRNPAMAWKYSSAVLVSESFLENFDVTFDMEAGHKYYLGLTSDEECEYEVNIQALTEDDVTVENIELELADPNWSIIYGDIKNVNALVLPVGYKFLDAEYVEKHLKVIINYSDNTKTEWTYEVDDNYEVDGYKITFENGNGGFWNLNSENNWIRASYRGNKSEMLQIPVRETVQVDIEGFQISSNNEGTRTMYSVDNTAGEVIETGLIYGFSAYCEPEELVINSSNEKVYSYASTSKGLLPSTYVPDGGLSNVDRYVMTMQHKNCKKEFLSNNMYVRAYAKYETHTYMNEQESDIVEVKYAYSDVESYSVFNIADVLYSRCLMTTEEGHNYLYNKILKKVDDLYEQKTYTGNGEYTVIQ
ncbi:MAG: hypothetical protein IKN54_01480 [Lachnospiraceae bacterium]|nr:hypothetical protein [Lachnospiraceae bacterium]